MAYEGWLDYNDTELVNHSRLAQLVQTMGIDSVRLRPADVDWIQSALGGTGYGDVENAPWYDSRVPASAEFAGIMAMSLSGLEDSTEESTPIEYVTDGGHAGKARRATLSMVGSFVVVAKTSRGAKFGKAWMDRVLHETGRRAFCAGSDLTYFAHKPEGTTPPPRMHRRNVRMTRGATVTRKRETACAALWWTNTTLTASDPAEYGEAVRRALSLGNGTNETGWLSHGSLSMVELTCPAYDYTPVYDPLYPALVPSPVPPNFFPEGWDVKPGDPFERWWARVPSIPPDVLNVVPVITLRSTSERRMVRVSVWADADEHDSMCEPLFSAMVTYLPPNVDFVIDGEQQAAYTWDTVSPSVRRADSLVFSPDANPVQWSSFNDDLAYFITLDVFHRPGIPAAGAVKAEFEFVTKSE